MIKCEYCGNIAKDTDEYCPTCGSKLPHAAKPKEIKMEEQKNINSNKQRTTIIPPPVRKRSSLSVCLAIFIVLVIVFSFGSRISSEKRPATDVSATVAANKSGGFNDMRIRFSNDASDAEAAAYLIESSLKEGDPDTAIYYFDAFADTEPSEAGIFKTIFDLFTQYSAGDYSAYVLTTGYRLTGDESLNSLLSQLNITEVVDDNGFRQAIELVFGKPVASITYDDIDSIRYISISKSSLKYSFEEPEIADGAMVNTAEYSAGINTVITDSEIGSLSDLNLLKQLVYLEVVNFSLDAGTLASLSNVKILDLNCYLKNNNLEVFKVFPKLEGLTVSGSSVISLAGVSELTNLKRLWINATSITDLSLLSTMSQIVSISLDDNKELKSIQTLENMGSLKEIRVIDAEYFDLNLIGSMKNLERLTIEDTEVKNLNFLPNLTKLKYLNINGNYNLTVLPDLSALTSLEELVLNCSRFENDDISFMNNLPGIKKLTLTSAPNLVPLYNMPNLEEMYLTFGWRIKDLSPLGAAANLKKLTLTEGRNYYDTSDISSIAKLTNLEYLNLSGATFYVKANPIYTLTNLKYFNMDSCEVFGDFSRIASLVNLEELYISDISLAKDFRVESDGFISSFYRIEEMALDDYTSSLGQLTNLRALGVSFNNLKSIDFAADMVNLEKFTAQDNYFTDISALAGLKNLKYVDLRANAIDNWSVLDENVNLTILGR